MMWRKPTDAKPAAPEPDAYPLPPPRFEEPAAAPAAPRAIEATRITNAISIRGEIFGTQDLFIDGELQGGIKLPESRVTVGANGRLKADIEAQEIIVEGQVNGDLVASGRVIIRRSGRVYGSLIAPRLVIEEGAIFNGQVEMTGSGTAVTRQAAGASVASYRASAP